MSKKKRIGRASVSYAIPEVVAVIIAVALAVLFSSLGSPIDEYAISEFPKPVLFLSMVCMWASLLGVMLSKRLFVRMLLLLSFVSLSLIGRAYVHYFPFANLAIGVTTILIVRWIRRRRSATQHLDEISDS